MSKRATHESFGGLYPFSRLTLRVPSSTRITSSDPTSCLIEDLLILSIPAMDCGDIKAIRETFGSFLISSISFSSERLGNATVVIFQNDAFAGDPSNGKPFAACLATSDKMGPLMFLAYLAMQRHHMSSIERFFSTNCSIQDHSCNAPAFGLRRAFHSLLGWRTSFCTSFSSSTLF